ncbi:MAG: helix-turn-helix domain-containing protein [Pirellulaceae bacterium]|nr:helix-turn-helix domain-containing protein [Pirellulaceae bacterium]
MISGLFSLPMPGALGGSDFIVGPENALVRAVVGGIGGERPPHNPVVLCGPAGVGKTTLAHLLADQRQAARKLTSVLRTTGSDLYRALAHATDTNSVADLRSRHHRADLLLIDDLAQLAGKPAAQQYLCTTIDALTRRGALVLATLRPLPAAADWLSPALASRLSGGLVVALAPPEQLTRQQLVRQFAAGVDLRLNDELVVRLAEGSRRRAPLTAPRLRHAILQLASAVRHEGERLRPELVARVLAADDPALKTITKQIVAAVAKQFDLSAAELRGKSRRQAIAEARGVAMCLCRRLTGASYAEIGRQFSGRDHTTVLHACQKTESRAAACPATTLLLEKLAAQVAADPRE